MQHRAGSLNNIITLRMNSEVEYNWLYRRPQKYNMLSNGCRIIIKTTIGLACVPYFKTKKLHIGTYSIFCKQYVYEIFLNSSNFVIK